MGSLAFGLTFTTFVGLLHFSWNPWYLRRPVVCLNVISDHYNPKNPDRIRFGILVHSAMFRMKLESQGTKLCFGLGCFCNKAQLHKKKSNFISAIIFCSWLVYFHKVNISKYTPTKGGPSIHSEQSWITQKVSKKKCSILKIKERFENWERFVKEFKLPELLRHINKCLGWKRLTKIKNFGRC